MGPPGPGIERPYFYEGVITHSVVNPGWLVDNIVINGSVLSDGFSTAGFKSIYEVLGVDNDFSVTLVGVNERSIQSYPTTKEISIKMQGIVNSSWHSKNKSNKLSKNSHWYNEYPMYYMSLVDRYHRDSCTHE